MTEVRWRVFARVAAALALMLMLGDPTFQPGGTTRAQTAFDNSRPARIN